MKEYGVSQNAPVYWIIRSTLCSLPLFLISVWFFGRGRLLWTLFTCGWVTLYLFFTFFWYPVKYRKLRVELADGMLGIRSGVVYTHWRYMEFAAVQYLSLCSLPLQRLFHMRSVLVYGSGCFLFIPCLEEGKAKELRDRVTPAAKRLRLWD